MPKNSNSGFGIVALLIPISIFSVLTYYGYSYFTNNKSGDVLQASTIPTRVPSPDTINMQSNINTYLFQNLFKVSNSNEFNRSNTPLVLGLNDSYDTCMFFPRSSRPLSFRFNVGGKSEVVSIYQNVPYQALPNREKLNKYLVVVYSPTFRLTYKPTPNQIFPGCGAARGMALLIPQPSTPITASNFRQFFDIPGLSTSPRPTITGRPSTLPSSKISSANVDIRTVGDTSTVTVRFSSTDLQLNKTYSEYFINRGIIVSLSNNTRFTVKANPKDCGERGCGDGLFIRIPHGIKLTTSKNVYITKIELPVINNLTRLNFNIIEVPGKCYYSSTTANSVTFTDPSGLQCGGR